MLFFRNGNKMLILWPYSLVQVLFKQQIANQNRKSRIANRKSQIENS